MPILTKQKDLISYITKDNSSICELMHPSLHKNNNQSLAQASVPINTETQLHYHQHTEELYYIQQGSGLMTLGEEEFSVEVGDTICIPPTHPHKIQNTGDTELTFLCCCSPAYSHDDTYLVTE